MFDTVMNLPWDMFPFPAAVGVEYLSAVAGKWMFYAVVFLFVAWVLDAATEAIRRYCGNSRRGRVVYFAVSSFLLAATVIGLFHVWVWPRFPIVRYVAQGTKNLALQEVGIVMLSAVLLSMALWHILARVVARIQSGSATKRWVKIALRSLCCIIALLPPLLGAVFCYREYGVFPPRVRTFQLAWRECIALFTLEAVFLAAVARPVWHRRTTRISGGHWKRFVPRVAWLVCLSFWLWGVDAIWDVPRLARISAGAGIMRPGIMRPRKGAAVQVGTHLRSPPAPQPLYGAARSAALPTCAALPLGECAISRDWAILSQSAPQPLHGAARSAALPTCAALPLGECATIDVPAGIYPPIDTGGRAITLRAIDGPERTIIDASLLHADGVTNRCATLAPKRVASRLERLVARVQRAHVLQLPMLLPKMGEGREPEPAPPGGESRLIGFTLRGGHADCGGGAFGGTLEDCILEGNVAEYCGGGAFGTRLIRCTVRKNIAGWMGGGVWGGSTEDNTITENAAEDFGGGTWGGIHTGSSITNNLSRHHPDHAALGHAAP